MPPLHDDDMDPLAALRVWCTEFREPLSFIATRLASGALIGLGFVAAQFALAALLGAPIDLN